MAMAKVLSKMKRMKMMAQLRCGGGTSETVALQRKGQQQLMMESRCWLARL